MPYETLLKFYKTTSKKLTQGQKESVLCWGPSFQPPHWWARSGGILVGRAHGVKWFATQCEIDLWNENGRRRAYRAGDQRRGTARHGRGTAANRNRPPPLGWTRRGWGPHRRRTYSPLLEEKQSLLFMSVILLAGGILSVYVHELFQTFRPHRKCFRVRICHLGGIWSPICWHRNVH